ncbi:MAG: hypothetical protein BGO12_00185 [Verrucomicrobia bacterium 61-8]|nr:MAG: hypothetical protein BGO12_00185 [Verrucomicrobia bacterium 61-8]
MAGVWAALVACLLPACATRSQFQKGYERGASDTVKRQYWILQDMQKREAVGQSKPRLSVYRLPIAPDPNATVKTVPYEISIPIYE